MERNPNVNWKLVEEMFGPDITVNIDLFAFWPYDRFPYVLCGLASKMDQRGHVYIESFQSWFKPIKLVPVDVGVKIKDRLIILKNEYDENLRDFEDKYRGIVQTLFPELKIK